MTQVPATIPSKEAMVDTAEQWTEVVGDKLKTEHAHTMLREHIQKLLRQGTLPTMAVIASARNGNPHADFALRKRAAEMIDHKEEMPVSLAGFAQEALFRGPVGHRPGEKNVTDLFVRDIAIAVMVVLACLLWNLRPTRNRASTRPSGSTIVALALKRRGFKLSEWQVEKIYAQHNTIAERLSASIPVD
jgi:hypothetical protein